MTYALKLFVGVFWGRLPPPQARGYPRHKISRWLLVVPGVLLVPQVLGGVLPGWFLGSVLEPEGDWPRGIAIWRHLDVKMALSLGIIVFGVMGFRFWRRLASLPEPPGPQRASELLAVGTLRCARWLSHGVQAGGHPRYVAAMLLTAVAAAGAGFIGAGGGLSALPAGLGPDAHLAWLPAAAVTAGTLLAVVMASRVAKVVMLAIVGYGMAILYVLFRAPDLALTQLLVETISLILLLLFFRRLPRIGPDTRRPLQRVMHGMVAGVTGVVMATLSWAAASHAAPSPTGAAQLRLSDSVAKGENAVNVILVDFRGVDTLGEIVVLAIAALGAVALLRAGLCRAVKDESLVGKGDAL